MAKILLVTDDPMGYRVSAWSLQEDGHEVSFATPDSALGAVEENRPDVIVFNTVLPVEVQDECVQLMKSMDPSARVIDLVDPGGQAMHSSDSVLREPCTPEELSEKVVSLL